MRGDFAHATWAEVLCPIAWWEDWPAGSLPLPPRPPQRIGFHEQIRFGIVAGDTLVGHDAYSLAADLCHDIKPVPGARAGGLLQSRVTYQGDSGILHFQVAGSGRGKPDHGIICR